ncbi:hypothetical protein [Amycolatopsis australiensis]|uniref:Major facilitator superfamily (MFS) profile domain-containing protein n=1 Tax=Amycolatopsis australiensis TaxID=546364 RepID=A0A1K1T7P0_9PSEU|nr:hypothetical protein [Amycolatopsis australiensis]SFW92045.1 hypothetical protein SAMN04489730_8349 [Amycolatopsis australiensis]
MLKPKMTAGRRAIIGFLILVALTGGIVSGALMSDGGWQWLPYAIAGVVGLTAFALIVSWSQPKNSE